MSISGLAGGGGGGRGAHLLWNLVNCFFWKIFVCDVGVLFCRIWIAFSAHGGIGRVGFPGCLIGSVLAACFAVVVKYLGGCLTVCLVLSCAGGSGLWATG